MASQGPETVRCAGPAAAGGTILLVEDDEPLARALSRMIAAGGYDVVHANSGGAAIANVRARSFQAVLSDLNLPDWCGVDVLRAARAHDPDVPLVLMTGCPTMETAIAAVSLGVLEYLVKPMSTDQLARVLGRASKLRRAGGLTSRARTAAPAEARRLVGGRPSWPPLARLSPEFQQLDAEE